MKSFQVDQFPTNAAMLPPEHRVLTAAVNELLDGVPVDVTVFDDPDPTSRVLAFDFAQAGDLDLSFPVNVAEWRQQRLQGRSVRWAFPRRFLKEAADETVDSVLREDTSQPAPSMLIRAAARKLAFTMHSRIFEADMQERDRAAERALEVSPSFIVWSRQAEFTATNLEGDEFTLELDQLALDGVIHANFGDHTFRQGDIATRLRVDDKAHLVSSRSNTIKTQYWGPIARSPLYPGQTPPAPLGINASEITKIVGAIKDQRAR